MHLPRRLLLSLVASVVVLLALPALPRTASADVAGAPSPERTAFAGTFRYAGDAREDALRRAAIDRAVGTMFFAIRPIARWRLSEATKVLPWFSVAFSAGQIRVRGAEGLDFASPESGASVPYAFRGERYRVAQSVRSSVFVQTMTADEGAGRNDWTLSPDGSVLRCKVTVTSPRLPVPIVYELTYKRAVS